MKTKNETFADVIKRFEYKVDIRTAFDDFLTMAICSFGLNPGTGKSYDEDLYLETIARYKSDPLRNEFPNLLACLVVEMEQRMQSDSGFDVLGEFYETHLYRKGLEQYFTPWNVCKFMAQCAVEERGINTERETPLRIIDPSCGSGRMLLVASRIAGPHAHYFGIDLDLTCVKMTALNFFLSGIFHGEVMCANALLPNDFTVSYKTSFLPFGLFRIKEREQSMLWHLHLTAFEIKKHQGSAPEFSEFKQEEGSQLHLF